VYNWRSLSNIAAAAAMTFSANQAAGGRLKPAPDAPGESTGRAGR